MAKAKIPYETDLAVFLIIVGGIIFSFMEVSLTWGFIALGVGTGVFLGWLQYRTELFS